MELKGILIGGLLPALAFGVAGLLQKAAMRTGIGVGTYLMCIGAGVVIIGALFQALLPAMSAFGSRPLTVGATLTAGAIGLTWAVGMALVALGIAQYAVPVAKLAPLYNLNTLVVVGLALVVFAEFREVAAPKLLAGAMLMLGGAWLVGRA